MKWKGDYVRKTTGRREHGAQRRKGHWGIEKREKKIK